ncbi:MAG: transposase [Candidatus Helarchaeota archaeon]|nr:transposase [Candidatus Helarchaeota archaeon]
MDMREIKGMEIAQNANIRRVSSGWLVPSQSTHKIYTVRFDSHGASCTCPDCEIRKTKRCKHIIAVEIFMKQETDSEGNRTVTKAVRITYPQDWKSYNASQTSEIEMFDVLLKDLVQSVPKPMQTFGRPRLNLQENLFCCIQKVYSQLSQRRAHTLYRNAQEREQITHAPHFNAVGKLLNSKDLTPVLQRLLSISGLPLKSVEETFAIDSSGFRTTQFNQYAIEKYGMRKHHKWMKGHILVGTKTNVIASARITDEFGADIKQFEPMVMEAHQSGFEMQEIVADKAYSSRDCYHIARDVGATAYIPFKKNTRGKAEGSILWSKMFRYFQFRREEFLEHYHKRSNVESVFMMVKAKFGDRLKSKNPTAQENELLCKFIAHNIVVLIHEVHELGIAPHFPQEDRKISL